MRLEPWVRRELQEQQRVRRALRERKVPVRVRQVRRVQPARRQPAQLAQQVLLERQVRGPQGPLDLRVPQEPLRQWVQQVLVELQDPQEPQVRLER